MRQRCPTSAIMSRLYSFDDLEAQSTGACSVNMYLDLVASRVDRSARGVNGAKLRFDEAALTRLQSEAPQLEALRFQGSILLLEKEVVIDDIGGLFFRFGGYPKCESSRLADVNAFRRHS